MYIAGSILGRQDAAPMPTPLGQIPPNRYPQIWGFIGTFLPLVTITIALRIVSRIKFSYIGADDVSIMIAYVFFVGGTVVTMVATKYGMGIHIYDVDYDMGMGLKKCGFASQVLYPAGLGFAKLSILLFLARVVPSASMWRKCIWAISAFVVCQETTFTITLLLQCRPISYFWDKEMDPPGTCVNQTALYYVDASVNIFTDLVILTLPWFIFSSLQIPRRKKYALLAICSVGCFTLITSVVRLPFLKNLSQTSDPSWDIVDVTTWSIAEVGSALTTASVPTIRPLITWVFPRFTMSSKSSKTASNPHVGRRPTDRGSSLALSTIGGGGGRKASGHMGTWVEIESRHGDDKSEEYVLNEDGRVLKETVKKTVSNETLLKERQSNRR